MRKFSELRDDLFRRSPGSQGRVADKVSHLTAEYPYKNERGETVWACCESSIGPPCSHTKELDT